MDRGNINLNKPERFTDGYTVPKEKLQKACVDFEDAVKMGDFSMIAKTDVAFHDIIVRATDNARLIQLVYNLSEQMYRYRFEYIKDTSSHAQLMKEHRILFESIRDKNKQTAAETAQLHIDNQENSIMKQLHKDRDKNLSR